MDFITGSYDGRPYFTAGSEDGFLTPVMMHDASGAEMILGAWWDYDGSAWMEINGTMPHAISVAPMDADGDGDLDLIQGTTGGTLHLRLNTGTAEEPAFAPEATQLAGLEVPSGYSMPVAADWDQDGRIDLVLGSDSGAVYWAKNTSESGKASFAKPALLIAASTGEGEGPRLGADSQVAVGDLNGDGLMDLLVGDQNMKAIDKKLTEAEKKRAQEVEAEIEAMMDIIIAYYGDDEEAKAAVDPKDVEKFNALTAEQRKYLPSYERNAFVWMYLQKPKATAAPASLR